MVSTITIIQSQSRNQLHSNKPTTLAYVWRKKCLFNTIKCLFNLWTIIQSQSNKNNLKINSIQTNQQHWLTCEEKNASLTQSSVISTYEFTNICIKHYPPSPRMMSSFKKIFTLFTHWLIILPFTMFNFVAQGSHMNKGNLPTKFANKVYYSNAKLKYIWFNSSI